MKQTLSSWEPFARSILRVIFAFVFCLHGYRLVYGLFPQAARRGGVGRMPLDGLPAMTGYLAIVGGTLLFLGLATYYVLLNWPSIVRRAERDLPFAPMHTTGTPPEISAASAA